MATRAFKSGVVVAALSQPFIPAGTADSLAGNLTISETLNGQFKAGQFICVTILPRTSNGARTQDTFIKTSTTNDLPIITTNSASGLLTSSVGTPGCSPTLFQYGYYGGSYGVGYPVVPNPGASFSFNVSQQSFGTLGVITISNIHLITTADAPLGPVLVDVMGSGSSSTGSTTSSGRVYSVGDSTTGTTGLNTTILTTAFNTLAAGAIVTITGTTSPAIDGTYVVQSATASTITVNLLTPATAGIEVTAGTFSSVTGGGSGAVAFETVVSNAQIGTAPATSNIPGIAFVTQTALGATKVGPFSNATKVAKLGTYETWRFAGGSRLAGKIVTIWVATKSASGAWSAFTKLTSRLADSSGNAFFWWKTSSKAWISVRAQYPGDANYFLSWSVARQARWL
jgi:hypothetical protein